MKVFVDLELISANDENSLENAIKGVEPRASNEYLKKLNQIYYENGLLEDEYRYLLEEYYDIRDQVFEEVLEEYKNRIDYTKVYEINSRNQLMYNYVNALANANLGYQVYIVYYYNTGRESALKKEVCEKYFPNCKIMPIRFYQEDYQKDYLRKRTSKALYVRDTLGLADLTGCMLIDKSVSSCNEWNELKGISQLQIANNNVSRDDEEQLSKKRFS